MVSSVNQSASESGPNPAKENPESNETTAEQDESGWLGDAIINNGRYPGSPFGKNSIN